MLGSFLNTFKFSKSLSLIILIIIVLIIFISCFFTPIISNGSIASYDLNAIENMQISNYGFVWPTPGYTRINSPYGKRVSPTAGASNFHKGIDIGAPEGSKFIAVVSGIITYTGFLGGGGYTITLSKENMKISYCHVSPNFIVQEGQEVVQGQVIGFVGPKNVYGVVGNQYKDSNRHSNKWSNNRTTFTLRYSCGWRLRKSTKLLLKFKNQRLLHRSNF